MPLASQVARTYFQLVRLNERVDVARRTLALGHAVALIRALGGGDAPEPVAPMQNTTKLIAGNARVVSVNGIFDR